jgi:hypothetical protein
MVNPRILVLALALGFAAPSASAQRLTPAMTSWTPWTDASAHHASTGSLQTESRDYRLEGAIVGGLLLGALGYWAGYQACEGQRQPTSPNGNDCGNDGLVVGAVLGGVGVGLGYLVGGSIDK